VVCGIIRVVTEFMVSSGSRPFVVCGIIRVVTEFMVSSGSGPFVVCGIIRVMTEFMVSSGSCRALNELLVLVWGGSCMRGTV
jgi:hypothetical protein